MKFADLLFMDHPVNTANRVSVAKLTFIQSLINETSDSDSDKFS